MLQGSINVTGRRQVEVSSISVHHCLLLWHDAAVYSTTLGVAGPDQRSAAADGSTEVDANLVTTLSKDEVVRHISQVFCLERLAASDIPMARSLLSALVQV